MNKRLQTILETVENLMEIVREWDSEGRELPPRPAPIFRDKPRVNPDFSQLEMIPRRPRTTDQFFTGRYPLLPPSRRPGAGDFDKVPYTPQRPGSNSGLVGAGSSVSGYDSGSDAPTPQPPSNKPPYPRLPPSRYDGFGKPKSPKGDDNYGPFQGKDSWRDRDEWVVDKEIQTYPPKYVYRRKTDADRIGDRFGSINRFRSIM